MNGFNRALFPAALLLVLFAPSVRGASEIGISGVTAVREAPDRYRMTGAAVNRTEDAREVVLRYQLSFYDSTAPEGDLPIAVIRKDQTLVLKAKETRPLGLVLIDEGPPPGAVVRLAPMIRVRRQRAWYY